MERGEGVQLVCRGNPTTLADLAEVLERVGATTETDAEMAAGGIKVLLSEPTTKRQIAECVLPSNPKSPVCAHNLGQCMHASPVRASVPLSPPYCGKRMTVSRATRNADIRDQSGFVPRRRRHGLVQQFWDSYRHSLHD